jgi:hypothetical protein
MKTPAIVTLATLALALSQIGPAIGAAGSVPVTLNAQNGSGEDGTATLVQGDGTLTVTISVKNGTTAPQPAHIHTGTCAKLGGVAYGLTNVVSGKSTTVLKGVSLPSLQTGGFAINIHKSTDDLGTYVSCGAIPK